MLLMFLGFGGAVLLVCALTWKIEELRAELDRANLKIARLKADQRAELETVRGMYAVDLYPEDPATLLHFPEDRINA